MKSTGFSPVSIILVVIAASSLISMIGLFQVDRMINQDLYHYGLEFSYGWAMPYWTLTKLMFAMGWFNIIVAIGFHLYLLAFGVKETKQFELQIEKETPKIETIEKAHPIKEETEDQPKPETKSTENMEQQKEQEIKPAEPVEEQQKEIQIQETQEKKEETPSTTELPKEQELQPSATSVL